MPPKPKAGWNADCMPPRLEASATMPNQSHFAPHTSSRGVALVLVLCFLVLISALVIAFFSSVATEYSGAKTYSAGMTTLQMADSAVHLVIGSIQEATSQGTNVTWASQPGMIRAYDNQGNPVNYHKLYSSDNMVVDMTGKSVSSFDLSDDLRMTTGDDVTAWINQPAIFTDLNEPVVATSGTHYPILDPAAADTGGVPSFVLSSTNSPVAGGANANRAPMPVKWIYVLRDGTLSSPASVDGSGKKALWSGSASRQPSESNPIVGRIAFWTDDESSKVNVNTASEGTFWDTPRTYTQYDWDTLGAYQPAQHEFQRYPGHPSMTSLSAVFSSLGAEQIYTMTPRIVGGANSSMEGTVAAKGPLSTDTDRLYATVDEFLYKPTLSGSTRDTNSPLDSATVEKAKFFLTAHSSSPDVNLFGKPRICLWPITLDSAGNAKTTPFDNLIAFCSTLNGYGYYFKRQKRDDPFNDLPSTGALTGVGRNRMLMEYLRSLTSKAIPGFGGKFDSKYTGGDRGQILTEMFDYIRTTNLCDNSVSSTTGTATPFAPRIVNNESSSSVFKGGGVGQVVPIVDQSHPVDSSNSPRGFGRFPTLEQASLMFVGTGDSTTTSGTNAVASGKIRMKAVFFLQFFDPSQGLPITKPWYGFKITGLNGFTWGDPMTTSTSSMGFSSPIQLTYPNASNVNNVTYFGGSIDPREFLYWPRTSPTDNGGCFITSVTLDITKQKANGSANYIGFGGGNVTVEIYPSTSGYVLASSKVQTITVNFPSCEFPIPKLSGTVNAGSNYDYTNLSTRFSTDILPLVTSNDVVRSVVATPGDLRLIAARQQISAADSPNFYQPHPLYYDKTNAFAHNIYTGRRRPNYGAYGGKLVDATPTYSGYANQYLVNDCIPGNVTNFKTGGVQTAAPHGVPPTGGVTQTNGVLGDWDNGISNMPDGPYINKPDEGGIPGDPNSSGNLINVYYNIEYAAETDLSGVTYFSPNRMVPSAVEFGSLPSGVWANKPWQTLLFRPGPDGHPGLASPPDHLLLDLFHMPVVEPYAISEPLATSGRINMNYQIAPFTYINRDTGIRAVLKSEKILAIPNSAGANYKTNGNTATRPTTTTNYREDINMVGTLSQFQKRFDQHDLFRSASEICSIDLVPSDGPDAPTRATMDTYWSNHSYTGDNSRERPYANVYPRLTTKSNTYTVHFRVQALKQVRRSGGASWATWDEGKDVIVSEYRGSQLIERYVDPADTTLPDFANTANDSYSVDSYPDPSTGALISGYKFHVLRNTRFAP